MLNNLVDWKRQLANWYFNRSDAEKVIASTAIGWGATALAGDIIGEVSNVHDLDTIVDLSVAIIAPAIGSMKLSRLTDSDTIQIVTQAVVVGLASIVTGHELMTYTGDWPILAQARDVFVSYNGIVNRFVGQTDYKLTSLATGLLSFMGYYAVEPLLNYMRLRRSHN